MGLTRIRAQQISDIDYKQAARVITLSDVTLSGGAPALVDGVSLLAGDRVLVNGQDPGSENGLYKVQTVGTGSNGTWVRTSDANETGEIQAGMIVMVTEGDLYADTQWKLITNDPIVVGTTPLEFIINILSAVGGSNTQIQYNNSGTLAGSANLAWTGTELSIGANIIPQANITYDLGNSTNRWNDIWLANSSIYLGNAVITANATSLIFTNPEGAEVAISGAASDITADTITASGNITGNYFLGNGSQLTGITTDATSIQNGTSNVRAALDGNVTTSVAGTANVLTVTSTGANVSGTFTATGNVSGDYILGNGAYLSGLNLSFGVDALSFTGDGSTVAFTILDGYTANTVMVFENGVAQAPGTDYTISGDVLTFSQAPGSGVSIAMRLLNGSSTGGSGGNVDLSAVAQDIIPAANLTYDLGNSTNRWNDIWLANSTIYLGESTISASGAELMLPAQVAIGNATIDGSSGGIVLPANSTVGGATVATPRIASIDYPGDDTAADPAGGQTIGIVGSGFQAAASVILDGATVGVVTFVSSTLLEIITPARAAGSYVLYVVNPDGGTGIFVPGVQYSGVPAWSSPAAGSLGAVYETQSISNTFVATSDSAVTYSLQSGTLPAGSTLNANTGVLSGTANLTAGNPITYNFTIRATDAELQDTDRAFSFTIDPDVVTWSSPTDGSTVTVAANVASTTTLSASSAVGSGITYSANALPTGLTVSGNTVTGTATVAGNTSVALTATADTTTRSATITVNFVVSLASDPYFNQTVLLLPGGGANGAQNNTFLDSSTNNFTITRNGNTTQGTFSPFSLAAGQWSNYFDGTGDFLSLGNSSNLTVSGDFTFEFWFIINGPVGVGEIDFFESQTNNTFRVLKRGSSSGLTWDWYGTAEGALIKADADIVPNVWHHVAVSRTSETVSSYYDGVRTNTVNNTRNGVAPSAVYTVGARNGGSNPLNGYISNMRLVVGTGLYSGTTIQVPTTPLTTVSGTQLLTCQSNRFVDNSTNAFAITRNGDTRVTPFSPFAPAAAYSAGTNGGSGYFDGTGDWLTPPDNIALNLTSGDFTVSFWVYCLNFSRKEVCFTTRGFSIFFNSQPIAEIWTGSTGLTIGSLNTNSWNHIEIVSSDSTLYTFLNGVVTNHGTRTLNSSNAPQIGAEASASPFTGYISGLRVVKGTALNTTSFTPPTEPPTAISNTSLLLNFTNAGIIDNTGKNNLETVGNAQIDTAVKKFGDGSLEFDGTGDWLLLPASPDMAMGTGDFTFECWIYATAASDSPIYECRSTNSNTNGFTVTAFSSTVIRVYTTAVLVTATVANYLNTWVHVAFTRSGSTNRLFINGNLENTATASDNFSNQVAVVGGGRYGGGVGSTTITNSFTGYIDDLRITKGVARYTSNFTPPTAAFPDY